MPRRRFQQGSLLQKSGRWYGVYREDVLQKDGTFKRKKNWLSLGLVTEQSERAARKAFQPYLDKVNAATIKLPPRAGLTLSEFVKKWRTSVGVNLKATTTRAAESHLRAHIIPKLGGLTLTEVTTETVQGFVAYLASDGRSRKTVENVLLSLSSILRTARDWGYSCGDFRFKALTMPREGVKKEPRSSTDDEVRITITAAPEPLSTIVAVKAVLGLRIGETLALRKSDVDLANHIVRIRQSLDAVTRIPGAVKSKASSADLPMSKELEAKMRAHLLRHDGRSELLFVNQRGRPFSANKLREQLQRLQKKLGLARSGFHSLRHGAASALLADGATPAVVQRQLRHSDARITLGIYGHVVGDEQGTVVQNRSTRLVN